MIFLVSWANRKGRWKSKRIEQRTMRLKFSMLVRDYNEEVMKERTIIKKKEGKVSQVENGKNLLVAV